MNTCNTRVNARSSQGTVVIVIECKESVIIVKEYLVFINTVVIVCIYLCLIHTYFSLRGNHAFKRSKEKNYNKKYYADNKEKIADKKGLIIEKMLKSRADSAARTRESYTKDPEKSRADSAARSCELT